MPNPTHTSWPGGYVRLGKRGPCYVIARNVGGLRFHVSTRCRSLTAAMKQLERFEANPNAYRPEGERAAAALQLTPELIAEFRRYMAIEKHDSKDWCSTVARFLADWIEDLGGADLRAVRLVELKEAVQARKTSRRHRIEAVKAFYAWLRKDKGLLRHAEDPTLDLPVPPARPAQLDRKRAVEAERVRKVLPLLPVTARDVMHLLSATGWHFSEARRFAESGTIERPTRGPLAVLITRHKSRKPTATPLRYPEHVQVAERIRARGKVPSGSRMVEVLHLACDKAGVEFFGPGVMRHSVATWARERRATPAAIAEFLGHDETTSRKFYQDFHVPPAAIPVLRLVRGGR